MKLYKADAVVLRARDCGSGNKLLILYSREYGKIKVMAHGVSKPTSRKRGAVQPFTRTQFLIYRGRELDSVSQCEGIEMFSSLKGNLATISYASYLAELVDAITPEREPNRNLFYLFLETLRLMVVEDTELLVRAFEVKAAGLMGYRPVLESCAQCQKPLGAEIFFSPGTGGVVCSSCGPAVPDVMPCSRGVVQTLKVLLSWPLAKLHQLKVERRARNRIKYLLHEYLKYHLEQDFKSAAFLNKYITPPGL